MGCESSVPNTVDGNSKPTDGKNDRRSSPPLPNKPAESDKQTRSPTTSTGTTSLVDGNFQQATSSNEGDSETALTIRIKSPSSRLAPPLTNNEEEDEEGGNPLEGGGKNEEEGDSVEREVKMPTLLVLQHHDLQHDYEGVCNESLLNWSADGASINDIIRSGGGTSSVCSHATLHRLQEGAHLSPSRNSSLLSTLVKEDGSSSPQTQTLMLHRHPNPLLPAAAHKSPRVSAAGTPSSSTPTHPQGDPPVGTLPPPISHQPHQYATPSQQGFNFSISSNPSVGPFPPSPSLGPEQPPTFQNQSFHSRTAAVAAASLSNYHNKSLGGISQLEPDHPNWWIDVIADLPAPDFEVDAGEMHAHFAPPTAGLQQRVLSWGMENN